MSDLPQQLLQAQQDAPTCPSSGLEVWRFGGLKAWRSEGLEVWGSGGFEAWRPGGLECWSFEGLEAWRFGGLEAWRHQGLGLLFGRSSPVYTLEHQGIRWRPYRVECTGSLPNSEVKRHRARLVLGWGTAREDLRVLLAFSS